jgi:hypothetical protein
MDRAAITKILRQDVLTELRPLGFKNSQRLTAWRYRPRMVDLVQINFIHKYSVRRNWLDCSYGFAWGIYLTDVPEASPPRTDSKCRPRPRLDQAHLARSARHEGEWDGTIFAETFAITEDVSSTVQCVSETKNILLTQAREWFQCYSSVAAVILALKRTDSEQRAIDPYTYGPGSAKSYHRRCFLAHLLISENRLDEAAEQIERAYSTVADWPISSMESKNRMVDELAAIERLLDVARGRKLGSRA